MADEITWTDKEFREFKQLVDDLNSPGFDNPARPIARIKIKVFEQEHGKAKCAAMFEAMGGKDGR